MCLACGMHGKGSNGIIYNPAKFSFLGFLGNRSDQTPCTWPVMRTQLEFEREIWSTNGILDCKTHPMARVGDSESSSAGHR